jgi:pyruvate/2-oxoglutarate/acetoin dehydrogenase E1 component
MDPIVNQAAKLRYMSGGQVKIPMTIRTYTGIFGGFAAQHSQSLESWFLHVPGLKLVCPSTPGDAKGLLKAAIRDDNPVLFLEHKQLFKSTGPVPEEEYVIPLGQGDVKRPGKDVTVFATSHMVHKSLRAAEKLLEEGIDVEVVDPRTLNPLDKAVVLDSVMKTNRLVIVEEDCKTGGLGAEISAIVAEEAIEYLETPIKRVAALDTPIPFSPPLEAFVIPDESRIIEAVHEVMR